MSVYPTVGGHVDGHAADQRPALVVVRTRLGLRRTVGARRTDDYCRSSRAAATPRKSAFSWWSRPGSRCSCA